MNRMDEVVADSRPRSDESANAERWQEEKYALEAELKVRTGQLEDANKELEDFAYSVSHDLRAPLRAIEGFSRIVIEDFAAALQPDARRYLEIVVASAGKMQRLIDDLLTFSRLNRAALDRIQVPMTEIARAVASEFEKEKSERRATLFVRELPPVSADPNLIRRVFQHLLENAFKFSRNRKEPKIEIGAEAGKGAKVYFVKDNGVGFDMAYAHKLFGVFQKLHPADEYEGSGIGLAMVQRIIHRHGGNVWVKAASNAGATFFFSLPEKTN